MDKKSVLKILKNPRITEKATFASENDVYVFDVFPNVTKNEIKEAVNELFKVSPVKVNITKIPKKTIFNRNKRIKTSKGGGKKAYVYLKKGDKIEFI